MIRRVFFTEVTLKSVTSTMWSEFSSASRVISESCEVVSATTSSSWSEAGDERAQVGGSDVVGELGARRRRDHGEPLGTKRRACWITCRSAHRSVAGGELGDGPVGGHREQGRNVAKLKREVDEDDAPRVRPVEHQWRLVAMIDLPTPPFPETTVIILPSRRLAPSTGGAPPLGGFAGGLCGSFARLERMTLWIAATRCRR